LIHSRPTQLGPKPLADRAQVRHIDGVGVRSLSELENVAVSSTRRIVVGFDGSPSAQSTLEWAACEAFARQCELSVVACLIVPTSARRSGIGAGQRRSLRAAVDDLRRHHEYLRIEEVETHVDPQDALLAEAVGAELLIVGASTSGAGRRWLFGSVPRTAARRSSCPFVVVRGSSWRPVQRIVVGVDGSNASAAALDWAIDDANHYGADLTVMHAWQRPGGTERSIRGSDVRHSDASREVEIALRYCEQRTAQSVRGSVAEGDAAIVLAAASTIADRLVVGSRGRSGFKTMLFGSVALSVVDHAECPVVVIHPHLRSAAAMCGRVHVPSSPAVSD
jgi:nucleotide-binding universal stress UspA family protein